MRAKTVIAAALIIVGCEHAAPTPESAESAPAAPAAAPLAGPHEIVPGEWIVVHPKKHQPPFVLSREEYTARRRAGEHLPTGSSLEKKPPDLLEVRAIRVPEGRLKTFMIEDVPVRRMFLSAGNAEVYWTKPYLIHRREADGSISEHQGADIYVLGIAPGQARLDVALPDGSTHHIDIEVQPVHPPAATRTLREDRHPA